MAHNQNLFAALRAAFPAELDATAIETCDTPAPLFYTWRDIDRASARIANLLESLELPAGARVAVQVEKSVEALLLYLAVLRAGLVYLPLNTAYQAGEIGYFLGDAEPGVVVCSARNFPWLSTLAFKAGVKNVFTLNDDCSGSLLERAAWHSDVHARGRQARRRAGRDPLHQRHHGAQQGRDADAWQPAVQRAHAARLLGLAVQRRADSRAAGVPRPRPVRGQPWCACWRARRCCGSTASSRRRRSRRCVAPRCSWACRRCTCACSPSRH